MKKLSLLLILLPALLTGQTITATYESGDIPTSQFQYNENCNGPLTTLELELPAGSLWQVTGVDVSYTMTAQNGGLKSHQRSMIYCENTATGESTAAQGVGSTGGTQSYNRSGLNIANGFYPGNTMLVLQMRAWRSELFNPGCNTIYNRVDNYSWTITVHYEQVPDDGSAGIGTMTPDASAILELQSMQKGFLPPRMSTSLKEAIPNPALGLMVYDTDLGSMQVFDGTEWLSVIASSGNYWAISGNDIYYDEGKVGIGTSEPAALLHASGTGQGEGNLLFEGVYKPSDPGDPAAEDAGTRMMWYPDKAAFRVGRVVGTQWDKDNIGDFSVAMGRNTTASGSYSMAMGENTTASGWQTTAMGRNTTASGSNSTAMGNATTASGNTSTAMGYQTLASGWYSTAMGWATTASGRMSMAIGSEVTAPSYAETVVGKLNTTYTPNSINNWDENDRLFVIGNGPNHDARSNAMTVLKNGNTGFGTDTPAALLHASGTGQGEGNLLFEGEYKFSNPGDPPAEGSGTRMMWYPDKAAFRAGRVTGTKWDKNNIGDYSMAVGYETTASGSYSTALGRNTTASGVTSTAIGEFTTASGSYSTALGRNTTASGVTSTAIGNNTMASGNLSTAIGNNITASALASTAIGSNLTAPSFAETVVGRYGNHYTPNSADSWVLSDRLFVIGNGTSSTARSNAMTVLKNGNIGIGTDTPGNNRLRVISSASGSGGATGYFENEHASGIALRAATNSSDGTMLVTQHGTGYNMRLDGYDPDWFVAMVVKGRQVGINTDNPGSFNLAVNGSAAKTGGGSWSSLSDARLKTINGNYTKGLNEIVALQAVNFNYIEDNPYGFDPESEQIGFIAQEVREIFPEAVSTGDDGYLDFNMHAINVALVNAVKEQQAIIETLIKRIEMLEEER